MFNNFMNVIAATADATAAGEEVGTGAFGIGYTIFMFVLMIALFYFVILRPQKKKEKAQKNLRDSLQIGDVVTTIGGITGIVVRKTEDTVVIETGGDKSKIRVKIWAISENETIHDEVETVTKKK
mgnify:CR=1 FL=1